MGRSAVTYAIVALCLGPGPASAGHLVESRAVSAQLEAAAAARTRDVQAVERALSTPQAGAAAHALGVDLRDLRAGIPSLADEELRDLGRRAALLDQDPVSGRLDPDLNDVLVVFLLVAIVAVVLAAVD